MGTTFRSNGSGQSLRLQQEQDDRSLSEVVRDLGVHARELVKGEMALAKQELKDNAVSVAVPAGIVAGAAAFALACVILLGMALAWGLATTMDIWQAFLVSGLVFAGIAAALGFIARERFKHAKVAPTETIDEAREDLTWIRQHAR